MSALYKRKRRCYVIHTEQNMRFPIGRLVITTNAFDTLNESDWISGLARHINGDWGTVCEEDQQTNEDALVHGERIFSAYDGTEGERYWIITERDRSYTTILLPEDY